MENPFQLRPTFVTLSGITVTVITGDMSSGQLVLTEDHHQPYGVVHGGVYCTLAETLASAGAANWALDQGMAGVVGVSNKTDFFRSMTEGVLLGEARPIHRGRTQQLWQVDMTREGDGKLVAQSQVRLQNLNDISFLTER